MRWVAAMLVLVAAALTPRSAHAQEVVESVVAVVNDEAIFLSELRARAATRIPAALSGASTEAARLQALRALFETVLDELVDQELIEQAAAADNITVSAEQVETAIGNVRNQTRLSAEQFWALVREQGFTETEYRRDIRQQLVRYQVLNQRVRGRVNITEDDVRRRYDELVAQSRRALRYNAAFVLVPVPDNASATEVRALEARARAVRAEIDGEDAFDLAVEDVGGGELGWLSPGDLESNLEAALTQLDPGAISAPVRGASGFFIFLLRERDTASREVPEYDTVRMDLYRQMLQTAMEQQERAFLAELRREATVTRMLDRDR